MLKSTVHVINLARRGDRWKRCQDLWGPFFNLVHFSAIDCPDGAMGCRKSHLELASQVLKTNPIAIVMEDDSFPTPFFEQIGLACLADAEKYVDEWDFINCGPYLNCNPIKLPCAALSPTVSPLFYHATHSQQTHFVCYNAKSLPLLAGALKSRMALDVYLGIHARHQWVAKRLLAKQDDSPSDIIYHAVDVLKPRLYELSEQMLERKCTTNK